GRNPDLYGARFQRRPGSAPSEAGLQGFGAFGDRTARVRDLTSFARLAPRYERFRPVLAGDLRRLRFMFERCPVRPGASVLEVGCGTGRLLKALPQLLPVGRLVGVDPEPEMVARARNLEVHQAVAENLPFGDGTFDLAYFWLAFHLLKDKP